MDPEVPPKESRAIPSAIILVGIIVGGALLVSGFKGGEIVQKKEGDEGFLGHLAMLSGDHVLGNPAAPVRIIEYADFQCLHCKRLHAIFDLLMETYGKKGEVAIIYRHFPIELIHLQAKPLAIASECANELGGERTFWKFHDAAMETVEVFNLKNLSPLAKKAGLDEKLFQTCIDEGRHMARVDHDFTLGVDNGVSGAPHTFIATRDGRVEVLSGMHSFQEFQTIIDKLLLPKR